MRKIIRDLKKKFLLLWRRIEFRCCVLLFSVIFLPFLLIISASLVCPPSAESLHGAYPDSRRIYARDGSLLREAVNKEGARAHWIDREDISEFIIRATVAAEDEHFFTHAGVNFMAALRAAVQNLRYGFHVSGASTITMQLARLLFKLPHNVMGKVYQVLYAIRLELCLDKETILVNYLNRIPYGAGVIGIETASLYYFNKSNINLSLAEAAFLAGLPQAPTKLDPFKHFEAAKKRQKYVLTRMYQTGEIDKSELELALKEIIRLESKPADLKAMHFTDYVLSLNPPTGDINTTLDISLNNQIQRIVQDHVNSLYNQGLTNAAAVVVDNKDGSIIAMVGSSDYWNPKGGMVNGVLAYRQPGSTLKPFTYALAFERGFTLATVIADIETEYVGTDDKLYIPKNFSGKYFGPVLLREALGRSLNIPAVKLANAVGVDMLLQKLHEAGFYYQKTWIITVWV